MKKDIFKKIIKKIIKEHLSESGLTSENDDDDYERAQYQNSISKYNKKNSQRFECPTCKSPNALSAHEKRQGYQCNSCADAEEGVGFGG